LGRPFHYVDPIWSALLAWLAAEIGNAQPAGHPPIRHPHPDAAEAHAESQIRNATSSTPTAARIANKTSANPAASNTSNFRLPGAEVGHEFVGLFSACWRASSSRLSLRLRHPLTPYVSKGPFHSESRIVGAGSIVVIGGSRRDVTLGEHRPRGERERRQSCDHGPHFDLHSFATAPKWRSPARK
jgi:hypothetical protein